MKTSLAFVLTVVCIFLTIQSVELWRYYPRTLQIRSPPPPPPTSSPPSFIPVLDKTLKKLQFKQHFEMSEDGIANYHLPSPMEKYSPVYNFLGDEVRQLLAYYPRRGSTPPFLYFADDHEDDHALFDMDAEELSELLYVPRSGRLSPFVTIDSYDEGNSLDGQTLDPFSFQDLSKLSYVPRRGRISPFLYADSEEELF